MPEIKTYTEIPYIGKDGYDNDILSISGYINIEDEDIGSFIIARNFRDNCVNCDCDLDYYNPAFLMISNEFSENLESNATSLRGSIQIFKSIEEAEIKINDIVAKNLHKNNDLIIYQILDDKNKPTFSVFKIQKYL